MQTNIMDLPVHIRSKIPTALVPLNYKAALVALAECERVDECKQIDDKCVAIAAYAKQIKDSAMMDMAKRIRLRAYRRIGELLLQIPDKGPFAMGPDRAAAGKAAGMVPGNQFTAMRLANIPHDKFDEVAEHGTPVPAPMTLAASYYGGRRGSGITEDPDAVALRLALLPLLRLVRSKRPELLARSLVFEGEIPALSEPVIRSQLVEITEWLDRFQQALSRSC